jgi:hypothetical protein
MSAHYHIRRSVAVCPTFRHIHTPTLTLTPCHQAHGPPWAPCALVREPARHTILQNRGRSTGFRSRPSLNISFHLHYITQLRDYEDPYGILTKPTNLFLVFSLLRSWIPLFPGSRLIECFPLSLRLSTLPLRYGPIQSS